MVQIAAGLIDAGGDADSLYQLNQVNNGAPIAVPLSSDVATVVSINLKPFEQNAITTIDNCFVELFPADASGSLSVIAVAAIVSGSSGNGNGYLRGTQVAIPPTNVFPKVAGFNAHLAYVFEFVPVRESLVCVTGDQLRVQFFFTVRNADGAAAHSFSADELVFFRTARRVA